MARRQSKAASRKARQRRVQRPLPTAPAPVTRAPVEREVPAAEPAGSEPRRAATPSATRAYSAGSSSLTDRERAEYHYVERDLRNIGILTAVLLGLLLAAWAIFNALGLVG